MKIIAIGPTYPFRGGIAHYTTLLVQHLRSRHEVRFVSYLKQYPKWLYPGNTALDPSPDSSVLKIECERILTPTNPLTWWKAFQIIKQDKPDVLLLQWWTPFWSPMLFFLTRMVRRYTQTRILFLCHHLIAPDGGLFDWFLARRILWRGHGFVVMSEEDFALLRRGLPWARIKGTTLPPFDIFSRVPLPRAEARRRLGLSETEPVILFFGFVRRYKGLRYLLEAMAIVRQSLPAKLLVVGEFWEEEKPYRDLVVRLRIEESVQFLNKYIPNDDVAMYFSAADVVAMPYLEATQSGIAQLALGFERPMIATSVGGMPETIQHERTGLIVPPADSAALSKAILRFFHEKMAETFVRNIQASKGSNSWLPLIQLVEELAEPLTTMTAEQPALGVASPRIL